MNELEKICRDGKIEELKDLSEDFIREFAQYLVYSDTDNWDRFILFQEKLSDQFYEYFLDELNNSCKVNLIKYKRVSDEFLKKHSEAFGQEVWNKVYQ